MAVARACSSSEKLDLKLQNCSYRDQGVFKCHDAIDTDTPDDGGHLRLPNYTVSVASGGERRRLEKAIAVLKDPEDNLSGELIKYSHNWKVQWIADERKD
jgi:hypothetical protein